MKLLRITAIVLGVLTLLAAAYWQYMVRVANPRVAQELIEDPDGERAQKVMLLRLPGGKEIPVNYLREGDLVFAGADGSWWEELTGDGVPVSVLVRGDWLGGSARAVLDDPDYTADVFERLRPNALEGFGTLIEIRLSPDASRAGPER